MAFFIPLKWVRPRYVLFCLVPYLSFAGEIFAVTVPTGSYTIHGTLAPVHFAARAIL